MKLGERRSHSQRGRRTGVETGEPRKIQQEGTKGNSRGNRIARGETTARGSRKEIHEGMNEGK